MTMPETPASVFMLGSVARLTMAAIFLLATLHSMRNRPGYTEMVVNYRLLPRRPAIFLSWLPPPLQLAASAALLIRPQAGAALGLALMAVFTLAMAINLARGRADIDCGCGGADGQTLSRGLVFRNLILMLLLGGAEWAPNTGQLDAPGCIGIAGSSLFALTVYFTVNQLLTNRQRLFPHAGQAA